MRGSSEYAVVLLFAVTGVAHAHELPRFSFESKGDGQPLLDSSWLTSGEALQDTKGLQLTHDGSEPSSVSSAFTSTVTNLQEGSMFVKMRVAGDETHGVTSTGLWLTRNIPSSRGPHTFAGMSPDFEGVGIVLRLSTDNNASDRALETEHSIHVYMNPDGRRSEKDIVDYATKCTVPAASLKRVPGDQSNPAYFDFSFKVMQYQGMLFVLCVRTQLCVCTLAPLETANPTLTPH